MQILTTFIILTTCIIKQMPSYDLSKQVVFNFSLRLLSCKMLITTPHKYKKNSAFLIFQDLK